MASYCVAHCGSAKECKGDTTHAITHFTTARTNHPPAKPPPLICSSQLTAHKGRCCSRDCCQHEHDCRVAMQRICQPAYKGGAREAAYGTPRFDQRKPQGCSLAV